MSKLKRNEQDIEQTTASLQGLGAARRMVEETSARERVRVGAETQDLRSSLDQYQKKQMKLLKEIFDIKSASDLGDVTSE